MKKKLKKGDVIKFISGNYQDLHATVLETDFESKDKRAMYGYLHTVQLSNGEIGFIEKSEHWRFTNEIQS
jgi:transcription antitermination factor NusG